MELQPDLLVKPAKEAVRRPQGYWIVQSRTDHQSALVEQPTPVSGDSLRKFRDDLEKKGKFGSNGKDITAHHFPARH